MYTKIQRNPGGTGGRTAVTIRQALGDYDDYTARYPPGGFFPTAFFPAEKSGEQSNAQLKKTLNPSLHMRKGGVSRFEFQKIC